MPKLEVLKIYSYEDSKRSKQMGSFECEINPESFNVYQENLYSSVNTINASLPHTAFNSGGKSTIKATIILEASGLMTINENSAQTVNDQITDLKKNTVDFSGKIHQPPFLKLVWGTLSVFYCRATNIKIDYQKFDEDGVPLIAQAELDFVEDEDFGTQQKKNNKQSPDLYHVHRVEESQSLAYISYLYYNNVDHIQLIAQANELDNLYACKPGDELLIPPLNPLQS
ncbi:CIS tube protein [Aureibacter tunicatorum]|uniref:Contractile injection system tube protein N-terminal domain-containing protein n=1 Tax=Aureibacter tunicatorum TaxID=866807 RepID=A0AAE4BSR2_9BACT|nr:hypothetical protein [Aureibacter tunicatorum]MDR6240041.1 hypothetical protein [Aureibacter tunicatorum]BDD04513.1 hypothetical protein AUTU_19960 [Aureibacter tunicatorum]